MMVSLRRSAALLGTAGAVLTALAIGAGTASASGNIPTNGELCTAIENIQFYDINGNASYVVQAGDFIRIDTNRSGDVVWGHGTNHSSRWFIWIHSNGAYRLSNCH